MARCGKRNYMDELREIICAIEVARPEPEVCNARCAPLGCPKGPCIGMCCYRGTCDACCVSQMPCCPPSPEPPYCCAPRRSSVIQATSQCTNPCSAIDRRPSPAMCPGSREAVMTTRHTVSRACNSPNSCRAGRTAMCD